MKEIFVMAVRNTLRNKRRSLLAVISIIGAMVFILFMQGLMGGVVESLVVNTTKSTTGHVRITHPEFEKREKFLPVDNPILNSDSLLTVLLKNEKLSSMINVVTPRIQFPVMLENQGKNRGAVVYAGDSETEKELLKLNKNMIEGRYIENERELIIGSRLAKLLHYSIGDTVKIMAQGADFALHLRKMVIVGVFKTGINDFDKNVIQVGLSDAQKLLKMGDGVQSIIILLNNYEDADNVATIIKNKLTSDQLRISSWTELGWVYEYMSMVNGMYSVIFTIVALFAAFIIGNIMMMVVLERKREIGILKSLGFLPNRIAILFLTEGALLGFVGTIIGIIMGILLVLGINTSPAGGMDFSRMMQGMEGFQIDSVITLLITPWDVIRFMGLGIGVSAFVTILPSYRAAKMSVVDSIKSN